MWLFLDCFLNGVLFFITRCEIILFTVKVTHQDFPHTQNINTSGIPKYYVCISTQSNHD